MNQCEPSLKPVSQSKKNFIVGRFRKSKSLAIAVSLSMLIQMLYPNICLAVTSGPSSPEFSSFEPVATTNMVNEFTGQFIYNLPVLEIPGAAGGGYALSLAYHGGDGPEAEASWVGHGWTLNPGSIIRNKRGLPDDYKNKSIKYSNSVPKNWTIATTGSAGPEVFSITGTLSATVRYNYYKGFGITGGIGLSGLRGLLSLNYTNTDGSGTFSAAVNPCALLSFVNFNEKTDQENADAQTNQGNQKKSNSGMGQATFGAVDATASSMMTTGISSYVNYLLTSSTSPYNMTAYSGSSYEGYVSVTVDPPPAPVGIDAGLNVSYTSQQNRSVDTVPTFGYMYTGNGTITHTNDADGPSRAMMDYTVENASTYNSRDKYLPVPTSTPDAYMVSGEGLSGGFRMYNDRIGIFSPNYVKSSTSVHHFGVDVHLGLDIGLGADITVDGFHTLSVQSSWPDGNGNTDTSWFVPYDFKDSTHVESENMFFRFNNDLGGQIVYDNSNTPIAPLISGKKPNLPAGYSLVKDLSIPGDITNRRNGRASYIGYHTNHEINTFSGSHRPLAFEKRQDINILAGRQDTTMNPAIGDEVGEVSIVNEGGNRYTYGLPVYNGDETNMRRGLAMSGSSDQFIVHAAMSNISVGEEYLAPYASQYLLTEITTPDYLDVNENGPDDSDFGGYTKFSYTRLYGSNDKSSSYSGWYKWRSPYNGLLYAPNRLSDNTDDMGSVQYGYKEVYYLDTIQTKTHYAVFTISPLPRSDGFDAEADETTASSSYTAKGLNASRSLTKIELYAKSTHAGTPDKLIKTVHFEYDYSCWPNNINSSSGNGKLTLKKVWFEYNGIVNAKISPYQFEYKYPTSVAYPTQYAYIQSEMNAGGALVENPNYTPYIDCWGNYQYDDYNRRQLLKTWHSQAPAASYDPAAWQLKRIILPSGGEIHVQYEENTYSYVQDRPACALVSLLDNDGDVASNSTYTLNTAEIGVTTTAEMDNLVTLINNTYTNQKIFFKFYYTLKGLTTANIGSCNGDYIEGYVNFTKAYRSGTQVFVQVDGLPKQVCQDYIHYQVGGKLFDGVCAGGSTFPGDVGLGGGSIIDDLKALVTTFVSKVKTSIPGANICMRAKGDVSYLRIPILKKLGGGIRVKRLLMYNKGIDVSSPTLYGTQYIYDNESNATSYGVATNEPFENKGENPLVTFLPKRTEQSNWDRLIAGVDRDKFEGPISWNILPAPSIGYSRVIKKNIYQTQATTTGYTVIDYNTVKDYPFDRYYGELKAEGTQLSDIQNEKGDWSVDFGILDYDIKTALRAAQGYCFIQNQMHGQIKQISDYRGAYNASKFYSLTNIPVPVTQKTYTYFEPGESIPIYDFNTWTTYYGNPGKETDITINRQCVDEHSSEIKFTGDITAMAIFPFIPFPIAVPINSEADQKMSSIVVNKVIHYPCILKSMSVMKDGYFQVSNYDAFDALTTKPVLTSTYDGFNNIPLPQDASPVHDGTYTAFNVPASSNYPAMGQKAWNERYSFYNNSISVSGGGGSYTVSGVNDKAVFTAGDLIALHYHISGSTYDGVAMAHVTAISGSNIIVTPTLKFNATLPGGSYFKIDIVQSGYTNQLSSSMDGLTEYGHRGKRNIAQFIADLNALIIQVQTTTANNLNLYLENYAIDIIRDAVGCSFKWYITKIVVSKDMGGDIHLFVYSPASFGTTDLIPILTPITTPVVFSGGYYGYTVTIGGTPFSTSIQTCDTIHSIHIIKAQSTTYSDQWYYDPSYYGLDTVGLNVYESGRKGKWRPYETYVFRDSVINATNLITGQRNYNFAGTTPFELGQWDTIFNRHPDKWIRSNHIDAYSPNGHATQEYDAENVYSAAKYGYHGILPYMVAQNSSVKSIHFESFENVYGTGGSATVEDMMSVDATKIVKIAHTGQYGYQRNHGQSINLPNTYDIAGNGLNIRFWADVTGNPPGIFGANASVGVITSPVYIARSGEWALYESKWTNTGIPPTTPIAITISNITPSTTYIFDDICVQPKEAKATSYVYDIGTYKLSAVLDDQNFATFYQYNGEGKLVRTLVETARGVKTVEESQYHVPLESR